MRELNLHPLPAHDPVTGGPFHVTELTCEESGVVLRGQFAIPRFARLDHEQSQFLEVFLRNRGVLSSVEKELGISYPTVRTRLDALLAALDLAPARTERAERAPGMRHEAKSEIVEMLERGEITPQEAKTRLEELR
ncbi:MAG: DUF2089 family protein [Fimbriimonadaceae bacterium]|nr:DUF2089 family protein [Fimbriimonadaceae bacterium]